MHDRRVEGRALTFGNNGQLFMNATTWWDHGTESIWSQPWGRAITGQMKDTALKLIPASIVPWSTWLSGNPDTTVLADELDRRYRIVRGRDDFVIGVSLGDSAVAYPYAVAARERVINDEVDGHPIAVFVDPDTRRIDVYLRRVVAQTSTSEAPGAALTFLSDENGQAVDAESGSVWDIARGVAVEGPLKGALLQQIPYVSSFDWAWADFFPDGRFYSE